MITHKDAPYTVDTTDPNEVFTDGRDSDYSDRKHHSDSDDSERESSTDHSSGSSDSESDDRDYDRKPKKRKKYRHRRPKQPKYSSYSKQNYEILEEPSEFEHLTERVKDPRGLLVKVYRGPTIQRPNPDTNSDEPFAAFGYYIKYPDP